MRRRSLKSKKAVLLFRWLSNITVALQSLQDFVGRLSDTSRPNQFPSGLSGWSYREPQTPT